MIKGILFDLDGTLLDRDASLHLFLKKQYQRFPQLENHLSMNEFVQKIVFLDEHGYVWKDKVYDKFLREYNINSIKVDELLSDYIENFQLSVMPFPNTKTILAWLKSKDFKLGIITNGKGQFQMDNIKGLQIEEYFDEILISEWEGLKKPDSLIFKRAATQLNLKKTECLFVGDHPEKDIQGARNVGMYTAWVKNSTWGTTVYSDLIITDLLDLKNYFLNDEGVKNGG